MSMILGAAALALVAVILVFVLRERGILPEPETPRFSVEQGSEETGPAPVDREAPLPPAASGGDPLETGAEGSGTATNVSATPTSLGFVEPGTDTGRLIVTGRVRTEGGEGISSATVLLKRWEAIERGRMARDVGIAYSDPDGRYRFDLAHGGELILHASHARYVGTSVGLEDSEAIQSPGATERILEKNIVLIPGASISGRVVTEQGDPVQEAAVRAVALADPKAERASMMKMDRYSVDSTDADGRFEIGKLPAGKAEIVAEAEGYLPAGERIRAPAEDVTLTLRDDGASISGFVYFRESGQGVPGAKVDLKPALPAPGEMAIFPLQKTVTTDESGAFQFSHLPSGEYQLTPTKTGLSIFPAEDDNWQPAVTVSENEQKAGVDLFLYAGHTIYGTVLDALTGEPLGGVVIEERPRQRVPPTEVAEEPKSQVTPATGEYRITGAMGPHFWIEVNKEGYQLKDGQPGGTVHFDLAPGDLNIGRDIELIPRLTVSGRVMNSSREPIAEASVTKHSSEYWGAHPVRTASDGAFSVEVKPNTSVRLFVDAEGYAPQLTDFIRVFDDSVTGLEIVLPTPATVEGVVLDDAGRPVAGANVGGSISVDLGGGRSTGQSVGQTRSGGDGRFQIEGLPENQVTIYANKEGFQSASERLDLKAGETVRDVRLVLRPKEELSFLAGRITDPENEPVERAHVQVGVKKGGSINFSHGESDPDGRYRVEFKADGDISIEVTHPEYKEIHVGNLAPNRDDLDFTLQPAGTVTLIGTVVDWKTREPIQEFEVGGVKARKDPSAPGRFIAEGLHPGESYSLQIKTTDYLPGGTLLDSIPEGTDVIEREFVLGPGGAVSGRVLSAADRSPVAGVRIAVKGGSLHSFFDAYSDLEAASETDAQGRFLFQKLAPGFHVVIVYLEEGTPLLKEFQIEHGESKDLGDLAREAGATLTGSVMRGDTRAPMPNVAIRVWGRTAAEDLDVEKETRTDADGWFPAVELPPGRYTAWARDLGLQSESVELKSGETREVQFRVGTGRLTGTVWYGDRPGRANMNVSREDAAYVHYETVYDGTFEIENLLPGVWTVRVYSEECRGEVREDRVEIEAGQTVERVYRFPQRRMVGVVLGSDGAPAVGVEVKARRTSGLEEKPWPTDFSARTNLDGGFVIDGIYKGEYTVTAGDAAVEGVWVPEEGDSEEVILRMGGAE
jgi:protocatechuate 3,4-dioxygenase beta subunit